MVPTHAPLGPYPGADSRADTCANSRADTCAVAAAKLPSQRTPQCAADVGADSRAWPSVKSAVTCA